MLSYSNCSSMDASNRRSCVKEAVAGGTYSSSSSSSGEKVSFSKKERYSLKRVCLLVTGSAKVLALAMCVTNILYYLARRFNCWNILWTKRLCSLMYIKPGHRPAASKLEMHSISSHNCILRNNVRCLSLRWLF